MQNVSTSWPSLFAEPLPFSRGLRLPKVTADTFRRSVGTAALAALQLLLLSGMLVGTTLVLPQRAATSTAEASPVVSLAEPPFATAYLRAYGRGDLAAADWVASPLNGLEWSRRDVTAEARQGLLPGSATDSASARIDFHFIGGARDERGFGHLLYLAEPIGRDQLAMPSAWRVDTDPNGRVIWAEVVFLFSDEATRGGTTAVESDASAIPLPETVAQQHPRLVAGIHASRGHEGYYLLSIPAASSRAQTVLFVGIDADGRARPGAWSYGQESNSVAPYGQPRETHVVTNDPDLAALRASYLKTL
jgi:hypothetical protein